MTDYPLFRWHWRHRGNDEAGAREHRRDDLERGRKDEWLTNLKSAINTFDSWDKNPRERQIREWNVYHAVRKYRDIESGKEKV